MKNPSLRESAEISMVCIVTVSSVGEQQGELVTFFLCVDLGMTLHTLLIGVRENEEVGGSSKP